MNVILWLTEHITFNLQHPTRKKKENGHSAWISYSESSEYYKMEVYLWTSKKTTKFMGDKPKSS